jgi:hypothetical protein
MNGRIPDRAWLVRVRRDDRAVIVAWGLSGVTAEGLAQKITDLAWGAGGPGCSAGGAGGVR